MTYCPDTLGALLTYIDVSMPWPIPKLLNIEHPKPISWRVWSLILISIASSAAGAVLLLWPRSMATSTLTFWFWLFGAPLAACGLVFGIALDRRESAQIQAEEVEREQDRIVALWQMWSRRDLRVSAAVAITPVPTSSFDGANSDVPVNKGRPRGLVWKSTGGGDRYGKVFSKLASGLEDALQNRRELAVTLLHGDFPAKIAGFEDELKGALEKAAPGTGISIQRTPVMACVPWVIKQVDEHTDVATLIVAAQVWPEDDLPDTFSEGVAAILLEPSRSSQNERRDATSSESVDSSPGRVLRPMTTTTDTLEVDIAQMVEMQTAQQPPKYLWHTGCDAQLSSAVQSAIKADPKQPVIERFFDHAIGLPGPATGWIMLATALEAGNPDLGTHMLAVRESLEQQLHLCMIVPTEKKLNSEGMRSES